MCHWVSKLGSCCDNNLGGQNDEAIETSHAVAVKALGVVLAFAFFFSFFFQDGRDFNIFLVFHV